MDIEKQPEAVLLQSMGMYKALMPITLISITLIFPLSVTIIAHEYMQHLVSTTASHSRNPNLNNVLVQGLSYIVSLSLYVLSTASVVNTISTSNSISSEEASYRKSLTTIAPRVWKHLVATQISGSIACIATTMTWRVRLASSKVFTKGEAILWITHAVGLVSLVTLWQMASVVSVLEDETGLKAALVSWRYLTVRGRLLAGGVTVSALSCVMCWGIVDKLCMKGTANLWKVVGYGGLGALLLTGVILIGLVVQTIMYSVSKSYYNHDQSQEEEHQETKPMIPFIANLIQIISPLITFCNGSV